MKTGINFPLERILTTTDVGSFCISKGIDPSNYDQIGVHSEVDSPVKDAVAPQVTSHFVLRIPRGTEYVLGYQTDTVCGEIINPLTNTTKLTNYVRTEHGTALVPKKNS